MTDLDASQDRAARVAGFMFVFALATAAFNQMYVRFGLIVPGDLAATSQNLRASEPLFRIGIASELLAVVGAIGLSVALYVLLKPVGRNLALLALTWRVAESTALGVSSLFSLLVLVLLGSADYAAVLETSQLQALVRLFLSAHDGGYMVALVFFGFGSTVFAYLFLRSSYLPWILSAFGVLASLAALVGALTTVTFPAIATMAWFAPIFVFELLAGLWLVLRGAGASQPEIRALRPAVHSTTPR